MGGKLYVACTCPIPCDEHLQQYFAEFGNVTSAKVMMDRDTGRSKGFGFVEMGTDNEAQAAIQGLHGQSMEGRALVVNEARPKEARPGGLVAAVVVSVVATAALLSTPSLPGSKQSYF